MKRQVMCAAAATVSLVIAGCGSTSSSSGASSSQASKSSQPASQAANSSKTIYYVAPLIADANWARLNSCLVTSGRELGYKVVVVGPPQRVDIPLNVQQIEQAVALKPAAIVTSALDPSYNAPIKAARQAHIPVFTVVVGGTAGETSYLGVDFATMGVDGAKILAKTTHDQAKIGIIYEGNSVNQTQSITAFKQYLSAHYPKMQVVAEQQTGQDLSAALEVGRSMLTAHPDITAFYGPGGYSAIAGGEAAQGAGKKPGQITVLGADMLPQQAALVRQGYVLGSLAIVSCNIGSNAIKLVNSYLHGQKIEHAYHPAPYFYSKTNLPAR